MTSCTASAALSRHVSSPCYTEHGQRCDAVMSGRITTVTMSKSGQLGLHCTVELNYSDLSAYLVGASVTRSGALVTCEFSCVPGAARPFFIPAVHSPLGGRGVRGSTRALLSGRRDWGHVAAPELTLAGRRDLEPWDTWRLRGPPLQGGLVRRYSLCGSAWKHALLLFLT
jgi:hypothetical protein